MRPSCGEDVLFCRPSRASAERPTEQHGHTLYRQRAIFHPRGLPGHLYWYALLPLHAIVFAATTRNITRAAQRH
jgi:hypothetical protein